MKSVVINLDRATDRWEDLKNEMKTLFDVNIDVVRNKSSSTHAHNLSDEYVLKLREIYKKDFEIHETCGNS